MKDSTDVPVSECLDVCLLVPGLSQNAWDEVLMTLLAFAGYHMRKNILDYLIQEGARELGGSGGRQIGIRRQDRDGEELGGEVYFHKTQASTCALATLFTPHYCAKPLIGPLHFKT